MKKALLSCLLAFIAFSATAKDITFGIEAAYAPYEFYNEQNELVGFDVDVANLICQNLNITCKFKNQAFDTLIPNLKTRRIDVAISAIDITKERSSQVDFTTPYHETYAQFIGLKDNITPINELDGKRVGSQNGTTLQRYLLDKFPKVNVVSYDSYPYAILDLKAGRINAVFIDSAVASVWLKKEPSLTKIGDNYDDPAYFGSGLAIAVRKGNTELLAQLNQAIEKIKQDGSLEKLAEKWFD